MSVFATIHAILAPTPAVDCAALLLQIQQFPSFSPVVDESCAIGEFASVSHCLCYGYNLGHASFHSLFNSLVTNHPNIRHCLFRAFIGTFK